MPKQKKNAIKYCDGCLSSSLSRSLKPIEEYYDVYMLLMNKKIHKTGQRKVMYLSDLIETYNDTWFEMEHEEKESLVLYQVIPLTLNNTQESAAETIINIESDEDMGITICEPADPETGCTQDVIEIESEGIECKTEITEIGSEEMAEIGNDKIESSEEILKIRNEEIVEIGNDKMQNYEGIREQDAKRNVGKKISKIPADNKNYYTKKINDEERMKLLDEKKSLSNYKNRVFKCETCVPGFTADGYEKHIKKFHSKSADYECHYCGRRMKSKRSLTSHIRRHYRNRLHLDNKRFVCDKKFSSYDVFKKHNKMADTRTNPELSCCVCDLQYQNVY
ncbi:zinc finger protein 710, partial [Danaus plexippus plexippus]